MTAAKYALSGIDSTIVMASSKIGRVHMAVFLARSIHRGTRSVRVYGVRTTQAAPAPCPDR
jgi:hypothetical protein